MFKDRMRARRLPDASRDAANAVRFVECPQTLSPSYRLAFADTDFLNRSELRPIRLQLELLKPELALSELEIRTTIVVFGSARTVDPATARSALERAQTDAAARPDDPAAARRLKAAERAERMSRYYDEARRFGRIVADEFTDGPVRDCVITTGGGPGTMEAANRGASEGGAASIGLNIVLPYEQQPNRFITPELSFQFHYFAVRKMHFMMRARALVAFPGGFGTLDELFDALTLVQTGKMAPIPIVLVGETWWRRIVDFDAMVEEGVIAAEDRALVRYAETGEEAWQAIKAFYEAEEAATD